MSFLANMFLDGTQRKILNADIVIRQATDWLGRPESMPEGGLINIKIESTYETMFWDWITSPTMMKEGYIRFYKRDGMSKLTDLEFWDCFLVDYYELYNDNSNEPLELYLTLSPGIIRFKNTVFEKNWKITNITPFNGEAININELLNRNEDEKESKEVINLKWKSNDQSAKKALVGSIVSLTADTKNIPDGEAINFDIYDKDKQGEDDYVTSVSGKVIEGKVYIEWKVTYFADDDDTDSELEMEEKGYTMPEFYFCYADDKTQKSSVLEIRGWLKTKLVDQSSNLPYINKDFELTHPDGNKETVSTDNEGFIELPEIKLGKYKVALKKERA